MAGLCFGKLEIVRDLSLLVVILLLFHERSHIDDNVVFVNYFHQIPSNEFSFIYLFCGGKERGAFENASVINTDIFM